MVWSARAMTRGAEPMGSTEGVSFKWSNPLEQSKGAPIIPRLFKASRSRCSRRLEAQDTALSRLEHEFESRRERHPGSCPSQPLAYQAGSTLDENLRRAALNMWRQSLALHADQPQVRAWVDKWNQNGRVIP